MSDVPSTITFHDPWEPVGDIGETLVAELRQELCVEHSLYGVDAHAVARRFDRNDVLFSTSDPDKPLAVVHLTWKAETDPIWPNTWRFRDWQEWANECYFPDVFEYHDDPVKWEYPEDFDYESTIDRCLGIVPKLEELFGKKLQLETKTYIQDASFHSQVLLDGAYIRFSNFGNMVATTDDDTLGPEMVESLARLLARHGYVFVPHDLLETDYSGSNPGVTGIRDWWIRYFDWV